MARQKRDLYQEVTDRILDLLAAGTVPWRNPITRGNGDGWPKNLASGKRYRGINVFLLSTWALSKGYDSDYWLTFRQAKTRDGQVRKGEKSSLVVFWKKYQTKDRDTGDDVTIPVLRHYNVFNVQQCDGITPPDATVEENPRQPFRPIEQAEEIVGGYKSPPTIEHNGNRACYRPASDAVHIADPERFSTDQNYYTTLFHELVHSTGHSSRLNRGLDTILAPFGSTDYSKEELIAEMGAAFLAAAAGISPPTIEQSAAYIDGWRKRLGDDKRLVIAAAGGGQKAADWILPQRDLTIATDAQDAEQSLPKSAKEETPAPRSQLELF